ncbi:MAG: MMPL family transporter [Planctomycetes bacterium]|nr:MMPL family transporter [Planctomycetota bacterium]
MDTDERTTGLSRRLFYWWADHPAAHVCVLFVMSSLAIIGHVKPSLVRDLITPLQVEDEEPQVQQPVVTSNSAPTEEPPDVQPFQVAGGECVVVATSEDFFTTESLTAIRSVVSDLESLPQVSRILWIESVPGLNLFGLPESLLPRSNASERQMQLGRQRTLENPFAVGQLVSTDGKTMLLHLQMDWFYVTTDAACTTALRETAEAATANVPGADLQFQVTGSAPLYLMMAHNHMHDSWRYQAIGYSIMLLSALILFRGFSAVTIVAIAPAMGVFWTMGMLHFFDFQDNPFNDIIVPVLISLVGLTDAVHLMVEIRNQRSSGLDTRQATRRGVARVGLACLLTSVTTAIGFASLSQAHHEIVREFGWCCVLGVTATFISVLTIVPLGCRSPLGWRLHVGLGKSLVDGQLRRIGPLVAWILRHDRKVAWLAIATTVALAGICTQLKPDQKRYSGLSESGEAAKALRHLDHSLGGLEFGFVRISWNDAATEGELLEVLLEVERALAGEPLIGHPLGLHELLAALPGDGPADERMSLLELLPAELKRSFYIPELRRATVQFRVQDIGIAQYGPVFERIEAGFADIAEHHPEFYLELTGDAVWRWRNIYQIVTDLATSLGTASIVIWLILTIAYRSIRVGLISLVPNLFPLVATGAMLCLAGQYLELVTVCVFTICLGIAVDDTIHFLTRYVEETSTGDEHREMIQRAFTGVGSALLMTTIVLVTGMMTAVFGDARDARLFGIMGAITLTSALFADIFFLPALLNRFAKTSRREPNTKVRSDG